jgi:flagellar protein FlbT
MPKIIMKDKGNEVGKRNRQIGCLPGAEESMSLKIRLKPRERLILGGAVVQNGGGRCDLVVENNVPILREKDILREQDADSACKQIYFAIQLMYVDQKNLDEHQTNYRSLARDVANASPGTLDMIDQINENIARGRYYQALKQTQKLIEYEQAITRDVRSTAQVPPDGQAGSRLR